MSLNTAITFYRKDLRTIATISIPEHLGLVASTEAEDAQLTAMYRAINELSAVDKALVMLYMEDYSYIEIGEMMGITANNVAVKMNRIKLKLKDAANKYL